MLRETLQNPPQLKHRKNIPRSISVSTRIYAVCMINEQYHMTLDQLPVDTQIQVNNLLNSTIVSVTVDQEVMYSGPIPSTDTYLECQVSDELSLPRCFKIEISGLDQNLQITNELGKVNTMLYWDNFKIEQLDLTKIIPDHGSYMVNGVTNIPCHYYGQNGSVTFTFNTPVYPWLLENVPD